MHGGGEPRIGQRFAEKFEIDSELGRGGMGVVYAARNITSVSKGGIPVAIKWLRPERYSEKQIRRFVEEAEIIGNISHPNVVKVFDVSVDPPYIVMERLRGKNLRERLQELGRPLTPSETLTVLGPVLGGMKAAHSTRLPSGSSIVHRDLKPENIFLADSGDGTAPRPVILDFGIAMLAEEESAVTQDTSDLMQGTPEYMSKEQLFDPKRVGCPADVHALGVILYEMLAGERPFQGDTRYQLMLNIGQGTYAPLSTVAPGLDPALDDVLARAMHPDQQGRFSSVAELEQAVVPLLRRSGTQAPPAHAPRPAGPVTRTRLDPLAPATTHASAAAQGHSAYATTDPTVRSTGTVPPPLQSETPFSLSVPAGSDGYPPGQVSFRSGGSGLKWVMGVVAALGIAAAAWYLLGLPPGQQAQDVDTLAAEPPATSEPAQATRPTSPAAADQSDDSAGDPAQPGQTDGWGSPEVEQPAAQADQPGPPARAEPSPAAATPTPIAPPPSFGPDGPRPYVPPAPPGSEQDRAERDRSERSASEERARRRQRRRPKRARPPRQDPPPAPDNPEDDDPFKVGPPSAADDDDPFRIRPGQR